MWFLISGGVLATLSAFPTATTPPDDMSDKACVGTIAVPTADAKLLEPKTPNPPTETPDPHPPRIIYIARPSTPTTATLTIALPPEACTNTPSTEQPLKQAGAPHEATSPQSAVQWARAAHPPPTWDNSAITAWLKKWRHPLRQTPKEWFTPTGTTPWKTSTPTTPSRESEPPNTFWTNTKPSWNDPDLPTPSWYGKLPQTPRDHTDPPNTSRNEPPDTTEPNNDHPPKPPKDRSTPNTPSDNTDPPPKQDTKPPTQTKGETAANAALARLGTPFSWGGGSSSGPTRGIGRGATTVGFDCSGLALYAWSKAGIKLGHYTGTQFHQGKPIALGDLRKGDLLFFGGGSGDPTHVGIYLGAGVMIHAPKTGDVVKKTQFLNSTYYRPIYRGAVRPG
ncbi:NlpC/P60 family protein [Nonomuraea sp. NPDC050556]|uniref:C40 family peptidase n=1 Tax=Nonomuraea sp. NPDC050556 TaxID=3364369 RepID=UPI0037B65A11